MRDFKTIKFGHVNCRSLNSCVHGTNSDKTKYIEGLMIAQNIDFCSFNETYLDDNKKPHLTHKFDFVGQNGSFSSGGCGIIFSRSFAIKSVPIPPRLLLNFYHCVISFVFQSKTIIFVSVYLPQKSMKEISDFGILLKYLNKISHDNILIAGDFNAWNTAWGDCCDARGSKFYDHN